MRKSAGIVMYHLNNGELKILLVHSGGPYWAGKQWGCWSIPKGEFDEKEEPLTAAKREFKEETSFILAQEDDEFLKLSPITQQNKKIVYPWAIEDEINTSMIISNLIEIEFPPSSGKKITIPEIDKGEFFSVQEARQRINPAQESIIDELIQKIGLI